MAFKGPKTFKPEQQRNTNDRNALLDELGFSSNEASGSDSESDQENDNGQGGGGGGVSFIEFMSLQKSLRSLTEQKLELTDNLREYKDRLKKSEKQAKSITTNSKMQVSVLQNAQKNQMDEKDAIIDSLKGVIEDFENTPNGQELKDQHARDLADQASKLSDEKRIWFEKAEMNEGLLTQLREEMTEMEQEYEEKLSELKAELLEARKAVDPVMTARIAAQQGNQSFNNDEIEALRKETAELRSKLRDAEYSASHAAPAAAASTGGDVSKMAEQVNELTAKNKRLHDDLKDAHAQVAKLTAMSASGSEKEKAQSHAQDQLTDEINALRKSTRDFENQIEALNAALKNEKESRNVIETEMKALKTNLQSSAAAGEDAKKSIEARLQQSNQDLASTRATLQAEQAAHATAKQNLEEARASVAKLKSQIDTLSSDHSNELQKERERSVTTLQQAKADAAAQIAEMKQRAKDDMKDMQERLNTFGDRVRPMVETVKFLAKNYKALAKQTRDLQGEIAPAVKQCKRDLLRSLAEIDTQYKEMLTKYRKEMALRKKLHNQIVDLKGAIRVFGRVRPIIGEDGDGPDSRMVTKYDFNDDNLVIVESKTKDMVYELDHIFKPDSKQEDVFEASRDLIVSVIDGYNVCIFAYGQTGSGKTFTMEGTDSHPGLNRRALSHLFEVMEEKKSDWSFEVEVSIMEIYNETLIDLLGDPKKKLEIRHNKTGPYVPGLSTHPVRTPEDVRERFKESSKVRKTASTKMNNASSRSHALLVVYVTGTNLSTGVQTSGKLNLIDLAGSERVGKSGAIDDDQRLKEATNINKSLSSLGSVIHALGAKQKHVPYRDSVLTHLLQDSLGGQAKTLMVVQISPVLKNVDETICSLGFAQRVRAVELGAAKKTTESAEVAALKKKMKEMERA